MELITLLGWFTAEVTDTPCELKLLSFHFFFLPAEAAEMLVTVSIKQLKPV